MTQLKRGGDVKPLTLAEIEERAERPDDGEAQDDMFACMCSY